MLCSILFLVNIVMVVNMSGWHMTQSCCEDAYDKDGWILTIENQQCKWSRFTWEKAIRTLSV